MGLDSRATEMSDRIMTSGQTVESRLNSRSWIEKWVIMGCMLLAINSNTNEVERSAGATGHSSELQDQDQDKHL